VNKLSKILVINGPNLNLLGDREENIYGTYTLKEIEKKLVKIGNDSSYKVDCFQSNIEGEIINCIQKSYKLYLGIIINAGGYSHTSIAIMDALKIFKGPVIEVHMSNIYAREKFRNHSYVSYVVNGSICGLGEMGYELALNSIIYLITSE